MKSGTKYEQGEIVIVPFPFTDLSSVKQRPVLILSKDDYNDIEEDIITCGITSNIKDEQRSIILDNAKLINGEIPLTSRIKVDKLFTLHKSIIKKSIAKINEETFKEVKNKLVNLF